MLTCKLLATYIETDARELFFPLSSKYEYIFKNYSKQLRNLSLDPSKDQHCSSKILG